MKFTSLLPEVAKDKLSKDEIIRTIRNAISLEYEAANAYQELADNVSDDNVAKVLKSVAGEELIHVGEFQKLLDTLSPDEVKLAEQGKNEKVADRKVKIKLIC